MDFFYQFEVPKAIEIKNCSNLCLHDGAFAGLNRLTSLSIEKSDLTDAPQLHGASRALTYFSLKQNYITSIPINYFIHFKRLKKLYLEQNIIKEIPNITPLINSLVLLSLTNNHIFDLGKRHFSVTYKMLEEIRLGHNQLLSIDFVGLIKKCPQIEHIQVHSNFITELPNLAELEVSGTQDIYLNAMNNPYR